MIELEVSGTKKQIKIPYTATLLLFWSTIKKRHPLCKIQYNIYIYIMYIYIYIFTLVYLFLLDAWVTVMIRICRQFFLEGHGERTIPKRYPNDTPKHNLRALGRRSPTHALEQNIDTLSALVQRIPIPYFMSGSNSLKRVKEEPNKRTKQSHKFSTSPWQCSSQDADTMD